MQLKTYYCRHIQRQLSVILSDTSLGDHAPELNDAMRYACLSGGQRLRSQLIYAIANEFSQTLESVDAPACAIELVHAFSLIQDDLPALDNDIMRRGKRATHIAYGQALALLASDALLNLAYRLLADVDHYRDQDTCLQQVVCLTQAVGTRGMIAGQARAFELNNKLDHQGLIDVAEHKTAHLFMAAAQMAIIQCQPADHASMAHLRTYSRYMGLAYQLFDDCRDKDQDDAYNYAHVYGVPVTLALVHKWVKKAQDILDHLGLYGTLRCWHDQLARVLMADNEVLNA